LAQFLNITSGIYAKISHTNHAIFLFILLRKALFPLKGKGSDDDDDDYYEIPLTASVTFHQVSSLLMPANWFQSTCFQPCWSRQTGKHPFLSILVFSILF